MTMGTNKVGLRCQLLTVAAGDNMALKLIFILAAALGSVHSFNYLGHEYNETALGRSVDKSSMKILKEVYVAASDKNVVSSPLGALLLLSQYAAGTTEGGKLQQEILQILGSKSYSELIRSYGPLSGRFSAMDPSFLNLKNKVYVADQYELNEQFSRVSQEDYHSGVEKISFADPAAAAKIINKWAEDETRGHIKNAVTPDALSPDVASALFNVIFFQGHWNVPFEVKNTENKDFHVSKDQIVKKPTMHIMQSLFYHESDILGARLVELPYKEPNFRMVVVLPNEIDGLTSVLEKVAEHGLLDEVFKLEPAGRDICLNMPKFEIDNEIDLNIVLTKLGLSSLFNEAATGIVKNNAVKVSKAFQKAFIKVDEEGATAGAFTGLFSAITSSISSPPIPVMFHVDRPFLYAILHEDIVLFTGTYTH